MISKKIIYYKNMLEWVEKWEKEKRKGKLQKKLYQLMQELIKKNKESLIIEEIIKMLREENKNERLAIEGSSRIAPSQDFLEKEATKIEQYESCYWEMNMAIDIY